jgi:hypothetical protein
MDKDLWHKIEKLLSAGTTFPGAFLDMMLQSLPHFDSRKPDERITFDLKQEKFLSLLLAAHTKGTTKNERFVLFRQTAGLSDVLGRAH